MTDFGRRPGEMLKSVYDTNNDGVVDEVEVAPAHKTSHQDGESDEISVAALSGELADEQPSAWAKVSGKPSTFAPSAHKLSHQDGGGDEINAAGLAGRINYIDLGDPDAPHFDQDDLTTNGQWHDFPIYPLIPVLSKAVLLRIAVLNAGVGRALIIADYNNNYEYNTITVRTQVASVRIYATGILKLSSATWVTYWATSSVWAGIHITVGGYFI